MIHLSPKATLSNNLLNTSLNLSLRSAYFPTRIKSAKVASKNIEMESSLILTKSHLETTKNTNVNTFITEGNEKLLTQEGAMRI